MSDTTQTTDLIAVYDAGVKDYLSRREVKLFNVFCETGVQVGRLAELVNANYTATNEEKEVLAEWALQQPDYS